jgi:hydroxymethylbilane synthase
MQARRIVIGTRGSKLALVQAEQVAEALRRQVPHLTVELKIISTKGDRILDVALSAVGDKGLFVKEIEVALQNREVDIAVHSGKDLPSVVPDGLVLAVFPRRVDPCDVLILPATAAPLPDVASSPLDILPHGATVGTSSLRRACQLLALRPDLTLKDVRGNVDTRLNKLDAGQYDALMLAVAGLQRLGLTREKSYPLPTDLFYPAVAQGALAIEARADDTETLEAIATLNDNHTQAAVLAERAFLRMLEGGCQVPIAGHAIIQNNDTLHIRGLVGSLDGTRVVRGERTGPLADAERIGRELAEELLGRGAATILEEIYGKENAKQGATEQESTERTVP